MSQNQIETLELLCNRVINPFESNEARRTAAADYMRPFVELRNDFSAAGALIEKFSRQVKHSFLFAAEDTSETDEARQAMLRAVTNSLQTLYASDSQLQAANVTLNKALGRNAEEDLPLASLVRKHFDFKDTLDRLVTLAENDDEKKTIRKIAMESFFAIAERAGDYACDFDRAETNRRFLLTIQRSDDPAIRRFALAYGIKQPVSP